MGTFLDVVGPGYPPVRLVGLVNPFAVALMLEAVAYSSFVLLRQGLVKTLTGAGQRFA